MKYLQLLLGFIIGIGLYITLYSYMPTSESIINQINATTSDNGCAKPAKLEIKQKQSNADVYNYPSLSTNY